MVEILKKVLKFIWALLREITDFIDKFKKV